MALSSDIRYPLGDALSLFGRTAAVVGACRYLGTAIAARLAHAGAAVVVATTEADVAQVMADIAHEMTDGVASSDKARAIALGTDPADPAVMGSIADRALGEFGRLDVWVQVASAPRRQPAILSPTPDRLSVDATWGGYLGARAVALRMSSVAGGVIVNVAPWPCCGAGPEDTARSLSPDRGLAGLTSRLAVEFEPFGVRVFGIVPTTRQGSTFGRPRDGRVGPGEAVDSVVVRLPLGRGELLEDAPGAVLFCASDLSMYMSGSTLLVSADA